MKKLLNLICLNFFILIACISTTWAQTQKGFDIDGEAAYDESGCAVSMPDPRHVAIGALFNVGPGTGTGQVRVYRWNGSAWVQKGADIDGEAASDDSGNSVSMPDSNTVAIGSRYNVGVNGMAGHVRVFIWSGSAWVQKGTDIDGENEYDQSGYSVSMPDANTLAIGAPLASDVVGDAGQVRVYRWNGIAWVQKGSDIDGVTMGEGSGYSISMPDSNTLAVGAPYFSTGLVSAGQVKIYTWSGSTWLQKGNNINGVAEYDEFGSSVSMPDANTVAAGAPEHDMARGHVRIFYWSGTAWFQKGTDIDGEVNFDESGTSVSMPDPSTVAIGATWNSGALQSGQVRVFHWTGSFWLQDGPDINGEANYDQFGYSVSMADSNTVATGAPFNDGSGYDAGHVRVYEGFAPVSVSDVNDNFPATIYPNPTRGLVNIDIQGVYSPVMITVRNVMGIEVKRIDTEQIDSIQFMLDEPAGVYFLEINAEGKNAVVKLVKE